MSDVLIRRWPCEDRDIQGGCYETVKAETGWAAARQGPSKTASKPPEARKRQGRVPLQILEGKWPCRHLDFEPLVSRTMR